MCIQPAPDGRGAEGRHEGGDGQRPGHLAPRPAEVRTHRGQEDREAVVDQAPGDRLGDAEHRDEHPAVVEAVAAREPHLTLTVITGVSPGARRWHPPGPGAAPGEAGLERPPRPRRPLPSGWVATASVSGPDQQHQSRPKPPTAREHPEQRVVLAEEVVGHAAAERGRCRSDHHERRQRPGDGPVPLATVDVGHEGRAHQRHRAARRAKQDDEDGQPREPGDEQQRPGTRAAASRGRRRRSPERHTVAQSAEDDPPDHLHRADQPAQ